MSQLSRYTALRPMCLYHRAIYIDCMLARVSALRVFRDLAREWDLNEFYGLGRTLVVIMIIMMTMIIVIEMGDGDDDDHDDDDALS